MRKCRRELRGELIKFLEESGDREKHIVTRLTDPVIDRKEGCSADVRLLILRI